ncbi:MAG: hypothetical protein H0V29_01075 [Thermoleophilaceae bacterium]|nr:hypothetical protein [Thermoleophilaceae bacterium]
MSEVTKADLDALRTEIRDVRYLTSAVLMALVGRKKAHTWEIEARVESSLGRRRRGTPLRAAGVRGKALEALTAGHGMGLDVETVEELARLRSRDEVASLEGIGAKTMATLDSALADRSLDWMEAR